MSDEDLIRHLLPTQPSRCHQLLYQRYAQKVYGKCLSLTLDPILAQDYTHDIFLKVLTRLSQFSYRSRFSSWLYSITQNYCIDQLHRCKRLKTIRLDDTRECSLLEVVEAVDLETQLQRLAQAIEPLSPLEQALLHLKYIEGWSLKKLAGQYGLKVEVVKMRLKRSRTKVQRVYAQGP